MSVLSRPAIAGVPLLVVAGLLWGTGGLLGTLLAAATGLSPIAVAGYRLLTGGLLLVGGLLVASCVRAVRSAIRPADQRPDRRPVVDQRPGDRLGDGQLGDRLGDGQLGDGHLGDRQPGDRHPGDRHLVDPELGDPHLGERSRPPWRWSRTAWRRVAAVGTLAAGFQACYFAAVATTSVSLATLVTIGAAPVIVLLVDRVRGRPAARSTAAAGALGVLGLALLLGVPAAGNSAAGAGFALLAAAGFAALTLLGVRPVDGLDPAWATGIAFTGGGAVLLAVAAQFGGVGFAPTPWAFVVLAAFGVLPTALAYTLYFRGLAAAPAAVGAVVALLEPLTGAVLAAVVLGERLEPVGVAGALLLGVAVALAGRSR